MFDVARREDMAGLDLVSFSSPSFMPQGALYELSLYPLAASARRSRFNPEFNV